ncbi:MAG TPA: AmmeMemoRadiSam system protein A [Candidatus Dojkabacteria bacterium]|nr:AmmeMemoRadiSam system protein A [Candidatus Dojkabacteria bacterium]HQF36114.1 AmmeMemoRadiSam system protein A [Candidatus Dojkabacteria bacterium]
MEYNKHQRKTMLLLARKSIETYLNEGKKFDCSTLSDLDDYLKEKKATFVTLEINGDLRGCIGTLEAYRALYIDVIEHAYDSAFEDTRFFPLSLDEFGKVKITVSILTSPIEFQYHSTDDIFKFFTENRVGVILEVGVFNRATFLPDVWKELADVDSFFSHLCMKAGLVADYWKKNRINIKTYTTETFSE